MERSFYSSPKRSRRNEINEYFHAVSYSKWEIPNEIKDTILNSVCVCVQGAVHAYKFNFQSNEKQPYNGVASVLVRDVS